MTGDWFLLKFDIMDHGKVLVSILFAVNISGYTVKMYKYALKYTLKYLEKSKQ